MKNFWDELKNKLKEILAKISQISKYHEISIINFSSSAIVECKNKDPNTFNLNELTFYGRGTCFKKAFSKAFILLKDEVVAPSMILQNKQNYKEKVLIFMSDGQDKFVKNFEF